MNYYDRMQNAIKILMNDAITEITTVERQFMVIGNQDTYTVSKMIDGTWNCTCPDFKNRHRNCKHIYACIIKEESESRN